LRTRGTIGAMDTVPSRIVLAEDAILLREALSAALAAAGFEVVGQAGDVPDLWRACSGASAAIRPSTS
jgi:DNA-binding NarL/FixJ family response regulator